MSIQFVLPLNQINKDNILSAGGKGANLGELCKIRVPVPEGFVITTEAYEEFLRENSIDREIKSKLGKLNIDDPDGVSFISDEIQRFILGGKISNKLQQDILENFKKLNTKYVAVRSSATSEDTKKASWAGQLSTYLNTSQKDLIDNIKRCWASLFSPRALTYRARQNLIKSQVLVAVIIQKMISSEVSGIVFTAHPVTSDPDMIMIEAGYGLGEAMVSGLITPDNYVINKKDLTIYDFSIGTQKKMVTRIKGERKTTDVPKERQGKRKLKEKDAFKLAKLCLKIEKHFRHPQDIEWAKSKNKIYILQTRPITA